MPTHPPLPTTQTEIETLKKTHKWNPQTGQWEPISAAPAADPAAALADKVAPAQPQQTTQQQKAAPPTGQPYTIQRGDTLSAIAVRKGTTVQELMRANPSITNPDVIIEGQSLTLPSQQPTVPPVAPPVQTQAIAVTPTPTKQQETTQQELTPTTDTTPVVQPVESDIEFERSIFEEYGIADVAQRIRERPTKTFEEIFESAFERSGLAEIKEEMNDLRAEIAEEEERRDKRFGDINEDPFLIESSRLGKTRRESERAERKLTRLTNQLILATNTFERGKEDAKDVATRALKQFATEREFDTEELEFLVERAEQDISARRAQLKREFEEDKFRYTEGRKDFQFQTTQERLRAQSEEGTRRFGVTQERLRSQEAERVRQFGIKEARLRDKAGKSVTPEKESKEKGTELIRQVSVGGGSVENAIQVLRGGGFDPANFNKELESIYGKTQVRELTFTGAREDLQSFRERDTEPSTIFAQMQQAYGEDLTDGEIISLMNEAGYFKAGGQWIKQF